MAIRKFRPYTPGTRQRVVTDFSEITERKPEKSLVVVSTDLLASSSLVVDAVLKSPEEPLPEESAVSFGVVEQAEIKTAKNIESKIL